MRYGVLDDDKRKLDFVLGLKAEDFFVSSPCFLQLLESYLAFTLNWHTTFCLFIVLDFILTIEIQERRLQTQVFKLGLAKSIHHARVLIRHRHIRFVYFATLCILSSGYYFFCLLTISFFCVLLIVALLFMIHIFVTFLVFVTESASNWLTSLHSWSDWTLKSTSTSH